MVCHAGLLLPPVTMSCSHGASYVLDNVANSVRAPDVVRKENDELKGTVQLFARPGHGEIRRLQRDPRALIIVAASVDERWPSDMPELTEPVAGVLATRSDPAGDGHGDRDDRHVDGG